MPTAAENLQIEIDLITAKLQALIPVASSGYSIDGQNVGSDAALIASLRAERKQLQAELDALEGPWEIPTRIVP